MAVSVRALVAGAVCVLCFLLLFLVLRRTPLKEGFGGELRLTLSQPPKVVAERPTVIALPGPADDNGIPLKPGDRLTIAGDAQAEGRWYVVEGQRAARALKMQPASLSVTGDAAEGEARAGEVRAGDTLYVQPGSGNPVYVQVTVATPDGRFLGTVIREDDPDFICEGDMAAQNRDACEAGCNKWRFERGAQNGLL